MDAPNYIQIQPDNNFTYLHHSFIRIDGKEGE